jgi:hypothetical protein
MKLEPEGFNQFWLFWRDHKRHTDGRGKCRKEYARQLAEGATPEDILLAAQWHVRNTKDRAFIPLAATWLNSEAWADEAPKERAFQEYKPAVQNVVPIKPPKTAFLIEFERKQNEA